MEILIIMLPSITYAVAGVLLVCWRTKQLKDVSLASQGQALPQLQKLPHEFHGCRISSHQVIAASSN
jgi:hypothetical protein